MRSFWSDPYLWVHLAGFSALPVCLELCLIGLATGEPLFPVWFELLIVGGIGILPIFWMQWQRPFSIFSLPFIALKPTRLTDDQRRILHRFKSPVNRGVAVLVALIMVWVLWQLYQIAPLASPSPFFAPATRGVGLLIASIAFLGCNLFAQVPMAVLAVLLTNEAKFATTEPYPMGQVSKDFTLPGISVLHLLPPLVANPRQPAAPASTSASPVAPLEETASAEEETIAPQPQISEAESLIAAARPDTVAKPDTAARPDTDARSDLENSSVDAGITAVEITEEAAVPDDFEEEAVTEDVEEIPDRTALTNAAFPQPNVSADRSTDISADADDGSPDRLFEEQTVEPDIQDEQTQDEQIQDRQITELDVSVDESQLGAADIPADRDDALAIEPTPETLIPRLDEESSVTETIEPTVNFEQNKVREPSNEQRIEVEHDQTNPKGLTNLTSTTNDNRNDNRDFPSENPSVEVVESASLSIEQNTEPEAKVDEAIEVEIVEDESITETYDTEPYDQPPQAGSEAKERDL